MNAGQTNIEVGRNVEIKNIKGEDSFLNGMTGKVTHPFGMGCTSKNWVGIYLDDTTSPYGDTVNIKVTEIITN